MASTPKRKPVAQSTTPSKGNVIPNPESCPRTMSVVPRATLMNDAASFQRCRDRSMMVPIPAPRLAVSESDWSHEMAKK